ncbi:hypothetical protein HMI55_005680 [Coelomomyces lativittatus]|nr:hypothetical protein HMI55_005680 [Coelomomyces lativittatus]
MYSCKNPFYAKLTQSTYCFQEDAERQCLHLELDMKGSNLNYSHGDHVLVYPSNSMEAVEALAQAARLDLSLIFTMKTRDPSMTKRKYPFPCPTTLRTCLLHFLDIQQPPKQHCLKTWLGYLSHASQEAKKMIETLATDINMYTHHILNAHCTVAELLSNYAVFGLGNRTYTYFNLVAHHINSYCQRLGP